MLVPGAAGITCPRLGGFMVAIAQPSVLGGQESEINRPATLGPCGGWEGASVPGPSRSFWWVLKPLGFLSL